MTEELAILVPPDSVVSVGDLVLDLISETQVTLSVSTSAYAREEGSNPTEHASRAPIRENITAMLTDTPGGSQAPEAGRARRLLQALYDLANSLQPVSASTFLYDYGEVMIVNVTPRHGAGVGFAIPVTIEIEEVDVVAQRIGGIPPEYIDEEVSHSAQPRPTEGERGGAGPTDEEEKKASVLHRLIF